MKNIFICQTCGSKVSLISGRTGMTFGCRSGHPVTNEQIDALGIALKDEKLILELSDATRLPVRSESDFKSRLQSIILQDNLSQATIAKRLGVSGATISRWFTKGSLPLPRTLSALAGMLDLNEQWLLHGKEPMESEAALKRGFRAVKNLPIENASAPTELGPRSIYPNLKRPQSSYVENIVEKAGEVVKESIEKADVERHPEERIYIVLERWGKFGHWDKWIINDSQLQTKTSALDKLKRYRDRWGNHEHQFCLGTVSVELSE